MTWGLTAPGAITHVYAFHGKNGTLLWHITKNTNGFPPYTNERALGSPILVDVNTDNYTDVVFSTSPNVYAINGDDGSDIWDIALVGSGRALWSTPAAADIDNDGFLDVVVEAAAISHVIIDLTMSSSDLSFSTENITENEQINIKAIIHNNGSATARNVVVSFFENDVLIGNQSETIPGKDSREVRLDWVPTEEGSRTIKIVIDPENVIEEIDEYNNELSKEVYVIPAFPDLIINSVHYYRGDGKEVDNTNTHLIAGENSTILVRVKNIGGDDGDNVIVRVFETGYPVDDDRQINKLKIQQILNVTFPWRPGLGENTISAWVDPDGNIDELNETNNEHTEKIVVNSKTPSNPKFNCDGVVHMPDGHTPAVTIDVLFTNNRTKDQLATITNATGYYAMDLSKYPEDYLEGDEIIIFASDGENESTVKFWLYSEDKNRFDNITLHMVPTYALSISVDVRSKSVLPNDNVEYLLTVTNRGNAETTVRLSISEIIDVETNNEATGWDAYLNVYMIEDIPPKSEQAGIVLTILAPNDAHARDQVLVAVTAESEDDPEQGDIVGMTTTVGRVYDFDITIEDSSYKLDPIKNNTARFNVSITNNGNDDDTVLIDLPLAEPELWSAKYNTSLDLMIGEEKEFEIILTSSESIGAGQYTFTLYVGSIDEQGNTTSTLRVEIIRADLRFSSIISF